MVKNLLVVVLYILLFMTPLPIQRRRASALPGENHYLAGRRPGGREARSHRSNFV